MQLVGAVRRIVALLPYKHTARGARPSAGQSTPQPGGQGATVGGIEASPRVGRSIATMVSCVVMSSILPRVGRSIARSYGVAVHESSGVHTDASRAVRLGCM